MRVDWLHFTPWTALAGGLLIGPVAAPLAWSLAGFATVFVLRHLLA